MLFVCSHIADRPCSICATDFNSEHYSEGLWLTTISTDQEMQKGPTMSRPLPQTIVRLPHRFFHPSPAPGKIARKSRWADISNAYPSHRKRCKALTVVRSTAFTQPATMHLVIAHPVFPSGSRDALETSVVR